MGDSQPLRNSLSVIPGASYAYDQLGLSVSPKDVRQHTLSFMVVGPAFSAVDTAVDSARSVPYIGALGKLYTTDSGSDERWCYARLTEMPNLVWRAGQLGYAGVGISFVGLSDWYSVADAVDEVIAIDEVTKSFNLNNPGNQRVYNAIFTLTGLFTGVRLHNYTNVYNFASSRVSASPTHYLTLNCGAHSVKFYNGFANLGDYANVTLGANSIHTMILEPGDNDMEVYTGGLADSSLRVQFAPAFS
jgi:hypothetical protein